MKKREIGILTFHRARNIGTCLQAFALQHYFEQKKESVNLVDYRPQYIEDSFGVFLKCRYRDAKKNPRDLIVFWVKTVLRFPVTLVREYKFTKFRKNYFRLSDQHYCSLEEMAAADMKYTHYFFGSDQIWNPELTEGLDPAFFGVFSSTAKKISYAASLGANKFSDEEKKSLVELVNSLDYIGVRECSAKELLETECDKNISVNIDPTLLIGKSVWEELTGPRLRKEPYIFVYTLEINEELIKIAKALASKKKLKIIFCDLKNRYGRAGISKYTTDPLEFLQYVKYADYVITNSFHGTVFSLIFEKQFISVPHRTRSTRVKDLLQTLGIPERIVYTYEECIDIDRCIDYKSVEKKLELLQRESREFIEEALK